METQDICPTRGVLFGWDLRLLVRKYAS